MIVAPMVVASALSTLVVPTIGLVTIVTSWKEQVGVNKVEPVLCPEKATHQHSLCLFEDASVTAMADAESTLIWDTRNQG